MIYTTLALFILVSACFIIRLAYVLLRGSTRISAEGAQSVPPKTCSLAVFLGSGGHTSEALVLLFALDFSRYTPRTYVYSQGDILSAKKAADLESLKVTDYFPRTVSGVGNSAPYSLISIPRARRVHQSLLTTPVTALYSLTVCLYHITLAPLFSGKPFANVLILNGPGTCCMLCIAVYLNRVLGLPSPRVIYVESFARVRTLSLSGKLLRPLVDRFVVQWPDLLHNGGRGEYRGWLI